MDIQFCIRTLTENAQRIKCLASGVSDVQAKWRPDPESWSILEVINHLLDEEKLDFRVRIDITLHRPGENWPSINPPLWVTERNYNERDLGNSTGKYLAARKESLSWLQAMGTANWNLTYDAPWGQMKAGDLLASWVAHDLLHMRQLVELHWSYVTIGVEPYTTLYAGDW